jgi:hypothetical protein
MIRITCLSEPRLASVRLFMKGRRRSMKAAWSQVK